MTLSWQPRRQGDVYCSQACGRGCTYEEYECAKKGAAGLVKDLSRGDLEWESHIWENLGWHYKARSKCLRFEVTPRNVRGAKLKFQAFLKVPSGLPRGTWVADGRTPLLAVEAVRQVAREELEKCVLCIDAQLVPVLDDGTLSVLLSWLHDKEHQHTDGEGKTSFRVILPEELFNTLVEHLEAMRG